MAGYWCNTASFWPGQGKPLRRRNSDTHLLANPITRIKKLELSRQHSLPDTSSKHLDKIYESAAMDAAHDDDVWLQGAGDHSKAVHKMDVQFPTTRGDNLHVKHSEQKGLYSRRSSQHFAVFDKVSKTLYSSDPDIYTTQEHLDYPGLPSGQLNLHDLTADLEHNHEAEAHQGTLESSKIMNMFSTIVPSCHNQARKLKKGLRLARKHSLDSQVVTTNKPHNSRSAESKRAIKIARPDHMSAMYISGIDTLGGLPDDEDGQRVHRLHLLSRLSGLNLELDLHGTLSRRSSCPVIFEGEESDDSFDVASQPYLSTSLDRDSHLLSLRQRFELFTSDHTDLSSGELSYCQSPHLSDKTGTSGHFFIGSDPFDGSDEIDPGSSPNLSRNTTSIEERRSVAGPVHNCKLARLGGTDLRETVRSVREKTAKSNQQVWGKQVKSIATYVKSEKQPQITADGTIVGGEAPGATVQPTTCSVERCTEDSNKMDMSSALETDTRIPQSSSDIPQSSSDDESGTSTSRSHPTSGTSSADESSS